ncbi:uncharacterized protein B0H64DRAFT_384829 [Chaetomium fimeti]|uniref:Uncharacterized protein n=1 Tax=Chaetomium fimeti TaxID=1854472 RepID=A0AAE0LVG9_9PEZI|nr:hypothetical protein B0H64DRAFT_384829 [Chaetomium fimeti]
MFLLCYQSSIRCTNTVGKFGQRCKLCTILKSGTSLTPGRLPEDCLWLLSQPRSQDEPDYRSESSSDTSRRPSWTFAGLSLSSSSKKSTVETGISRNGRNTMRM